MGTEAVPACALNFWGTALLRSAGAPARVEEDFSPQCPLELPTLSSNRFRKASGLGCVGRFHPFPQDRVQTTCRVLVSYEKWAWWGGGE